MNAGLISNKDMQMRIEQIEANIHMLMSSESARKLTMSLGIMAAQDVQIQSPNQEKNKAKDL